MSAVFDIWNCANTHRSRHTNQSSPPSNPLLCLSCFSVAPVYPRQTKGWKGSVSSSNPHLEALSEPPSQTNTRTFVSLHMLLLFMYVLCHLLCLHAFLWTYVKNRPLISQWMGLILLFAVGLIDSRSVSSHILREKEAKWKDLTLV